ncbi:hypothetical protein KSP40_PGU000014 [Platanthera guangdongensis]|uniref:Uncharacterized protein n=1 Tax=Platanthera guangdongensis TaxID=2320717 RepID=A0ABR2LUJ8_9ASPA
MASEADQQNHHHHPQDHHHTHDRGGHGDGSSSWVDPDGRVYHSHNGLAPHSHEPIDSPGLYSARAPLLPTRYFKERAFTVGIGGPVGTRWALISLTYGSTLMTSLIMPFPLLFIEVYLLIFKIFGLYASHLLLEIRKQNFRNHEIW